MAYLIYTYRYIYQGEKTGGNAILMLALRTTAETKKGKKNVFSVSPPLKTWGMCFSCDVSASPVTLYPRRMELKVLVLVPYTCMYRYFFEPS